MTDVKLEHSVGAQLKNKRIEKNLSLEQISKMTRINKTVLENIESSNFKELPPKTVVKGFVKNYANCLQMDFAPLILKLDRECIQKTQISSEFRKRWDQAHAVTQGSSFRTKVLTFSFLILFVVSALVLHLAIQRHETGEKSFEISKIKNVLGLGDSSSRKISSEKKINKVEPKINKVEPKINKVSNEKIITKKSTNTARQKEIAKKEIAKKEAKKTKVNKDPLRSLAHPKPYKENKNSETSTEKDVDKKIKTIQENQESQDLNGGYLASLGQQVLVKALGPVKIRPVIDKQKSSTVTLKSSQMHLFKGQKSLTLEINKGSNVELVYNGIVQKKITSTDPIVLNWQSKKTSSP